MLMLSGMALLVAPVAAYNADWAALVVLVTAVVVSGACGLIGPRLGPVDKAMDRSTTGLLADVALAWILVVAGAAAVTWSLASVGDQPFLDDPMSALFETVSGVTTTGLTMVRSPQDLSPTMQWWRSVMQWAGALGVVVFALTIAERSGDHDEFLNEAWGEQPIEHPRKAIMLIAGLTSGLALVTAIGLWAGGDPLWRAMNHGMTAAATGGYTITGDSATASTPVSRIVLAVAITVSAVSFGTLWGTVSGQGPALWRRTQLRWGLGLLILFAALAVLVNGGGAPAGGVLFNAASASSTAGFSAGDAQKTVPAVALVTMVSMFIGGAAGSTAGGVKTARVAWLTKAVWRWLPQGNDVYAADYLWDGEEVDPNEAARRVTGSGALVGLWLVSSLILTLVLVKMTGSGLTDAFFETLSALGGVGLSRGLTAAGLSTGPKAVLSSAMLIGRVEFTAFIALAFRAGVPHRSRSASR